MDNVFSLRAMKHKYTSTIARNSKTRSTRVSYHCVRQACEILTKLLNAHASISIQQLPVLIEITTCKPVLILRYRVEISTAEGQFYSSSRYPGMLWGRNHPIFFRNGFNFILVMLILEPLEVYFNQSYRINISELMKMLIQLQVYLVIFSTD